MKNKNWIVFALFTISIFPLAAQEKAKKDSVILSEIVVTGSQVQLSRNDIPLTISVVNRKMLDESGRSNIMPMLSEYVPGLFVTERGIAGYGVANGSAGAITIRGVGSAAGKLGDPLTNTQVLFLIDGHPQFMGLMGHHLSDSYLSENVERVEVVRGPASVLYGSNAMGGVVNIITRKSKQDGFHASADLSYGSYNSLRLATHAMLKSGKWDGFLSFNHDETDGERANSQYKSNSVYGNAAYEFSKHLNVTGDFNLTKYKAYDPDTVGAPVNPNKWVDILRGVASMSFQNQFEKTSGAVKLFWNFGDHDIYDGYHSTDYCAGISLYQSVRFFKGNVVTAGVDYKRYGGFAENNTLNDFMKKLMQLPTDKTLSSIAGYLTLQQDILNDKLSVNAGLRYESNSIYGGEWVPQGGLAYKPVTGTVLKASVAKGFRSPTIKELYMFPPHNVDLQPERMVNYELSWLQKWANGRVATELTTFVAHGSNLIKLVNMKYFNTGSFHNKGIEAVVDYRMTEKLNLSANYSYLNMETPVLAAPKHQFFLTLGYNPLKKLSFHLSAQQIAGLYIQTTPAKTEDYTLVNLRIVYRPISSVELYASAANLLNQQYQINKGYPMPPVNFMAGVKYKL